MKTIKNMFIAGVTAIAIVFTVSSCQKGFDAKTYAPAKPLPSYGGFSSSKDIEPGNLVAYWPFNSDLTDSIAKTVGVATGTSFSAGVAGKGLQGADKSYAISNTSAAIQGLHNFTISLWAKMPQNTNALGLMSIANNLTFWGNFDVFFDTGDDLTATSGILKVHMWNKSASATGTDAWLGGFKVDKPWGNWINILVTYDDAASKVTVYYNGGAAGNTVANGFAPLDWSAAKQMVFGTMQFQTTPSLTTNTGAQDWAGFLTGTLDQVRIYNKILTTTEISALYNLEKAGR
ncbi:MAG: hypothetical protein JWR09_845 [Mucilaginibacter sp.]|nr:hypothetical protein [Mucilaginibacter sp.]